jgi:IS30 family transposase
MKYRQITSHERYVIQALRKEGLSLSAIARHLGRAPSTISREVRRNVSTQGRYSPPKADSYARARRSRTRRGARVARETWREVERLLRRRWSPQQIANRLNTSGVHSISHETIYGHIWRDKRRGGSLWTHLRQSPKKRRKRYGARDSRGRLAGKRLISERPAEIETRLEPGHWEIDTIVGTDRGRHSIVTLVERMTGYVVMGKLERHCAGECAAKVIELIYRHAGRVLTITADNGSEFHSYADVEAATGVVFYFATPHHAWERGTNENTNGLIRQYLPKRTSLAHVTQADCDRIAHELNTRPRKRLGYKTPEECYVQAW